MECTIEGNGIVIELWIHGGVMFVLGGIMLLFLICSAIAWFEILYEKMNK